MLPLETPSNNTKIAMEVDKMASLIEKATDGKLMCGDRPDWQKIMRVVDMLRSCPYLSLLSIQLLRKILKYDNLDTVMLALHLLDSMTKNCAQTLIFIADPDFVRTLYKLAMNLRKATVSKFTKWRKKSESGDAWKRASIMEKSKLQIQALAENLGADRRFKEFGLVYRKMLAEGVRFPERTKDESVHIAVPPSQCHPMIQNNPTTIPNIYKITNGVPTNPLRTKGYKQHPNPPDSPPARIPQKSLDFPRRQFTTSKETATEIIWKTRIPNLKDKNANVQDVAFALFDMLLKSNGGVESVELMSHFYRNLYEELEELRQLVFMLTDKEQIQKTLMVIDLGNDVLADFDGLLDGSRKRGAAVTKRKLHENNKQADTKRKLHENDKHETSEPKEMNLLGLVNEKKEEDERNVKEGVIKPFLSNEVSENENPEGVSRECKIDVEVEPPFLVDVSFLGVPTAAKRERSKMKGKKGRKESDLLDITSIQLDNSAPNGFPMNESNAMAYKYERRDSKSPPNSCVSEPTKHTVNFQDGEEVDVGSNLDSGLAVDEFEFFGKAKTTASSGLSCNSEGREAANTDPFDAFGLSDTKLSQREKNPFESFGDSKSTGVLAREVFSDERLIAQDGGTHVKTSKSNEDSPLKISPLNPFGSPKQRTRSTEDNQDKTRGTPRPGSGNPFDFLSFEPASRTPKKARSKSAQGSIVGEPGNFNPFAVFDD